jgi:deoxyhypusine synthase
LKDAESPEKFLKEKIEPIDVEGTKSVSDVLRAFENTSFQSRNLAKCVEIYLKMLQDPDDPTIFLGLSGALIPAGMKKVISTMIRKGMVDVIVTTGANAYHDLVEALGYHHYKGSPYADDEELLRHGVDRIYDTFASEAQFLTVDGKIAALADRIKQETSNTPTLSSRRLLFELGKFIDTEGAEEEKASSFLWNAWRYGVPVFVPALCDSSIGLALTKHYVLSLQKGKPSLIIDQIRDNYEIYEIKKAAKKTGVIYLGGGVPKNYVQQTAYLEGLFGQRGRGHDYGFQLTTDRPEWGGLSGCTFKEALSWGKVKEEQNFVACYCDATIAFPLIVRAVLERLEKQ